MAIAPSRTTKLRAPGDVPGMSTLTQSGSPRCPIKVLSICPIQLRPCEWAVWPLVRPRADRRGHSARTSVWGGKNPSLRVTNTAWATLASGPRRGGRARSSSRRDAHREPLDTHLPPQDPGSWSSWLHARWRSRWSRLRLAPPEGCRRWRPLPAPPSLPARRCCPSSAHPRRSRPSTRH